MTLDVAAALRSCKANAIEAVRNVDIGAKCRELGWDVSDAKVGAYLRGEHVPVPWVLVIAVEQVAGRPGFVAAQLGVGPDGQSWRDLVVADPRLPGNYADTLRAAIDGIFTGLERRGVL